MQTSEGMNHQMSCLIKLRNACLLANKTLADISSIDLELTKLHLTQLRVFILLSTTNIAHPAALILKQSCK